MIVTMLCYAKFENCKSLDRSKPLRRLLELRTLRELLLCSGTVACQHLDES